MSSLFSAPAVGNNSYATTLRPRLRGGASSLQRANDPHSGRHGHPSPRCAPAAAPAVCVLDTTPAIGPGRGLYSQSVPCPCRCRGPSTQRSTRELPCTASQLTLLPLPPPTPQLSRAPTLPAHTHHHHPAAAPLHATPTPSASKPPRLPALPAAHSPVRARRWPAVHPDSCSATPPLCPRPPVQVVCPSAA